MFDFFKNLFRKKPCEHNHYYTRDYFASDRTPMTEFKCYDCNFSYNDHVHTNVETWQERIVDIKPVQIHPNNVDSDDDMMREVVAKCFNSGKMVIGNRNEDGSFETREIELDK